jgi:hypothetical protein
VLVYGRNRYLTAANASIKRGFCVSITVGNNSSTIVTRRSNFGCKKEMTNSTIINDQIIVPKTPKLLTTISSGKVLQM